MQLHTLKTELKGRLDIEEVKNKTIDSKAFETSPVFSYYSSFTLPIIIRTETLKIPNRSL